MLWVTDYYIKYDWASNEHIQNLYPNITHLSHWDFPSPVFQCCFQNNLPQLWIRKYSLWDLTHALGKTLFLSVQSFSPHLFICSLLIHSFSSCSLTTTKSNQQCDSFLLSTTGHLGTCFWVATLQALSSLMHPGGPVMWGRAGELWEWLQSTGESQAKTRPAWTGEESSFLY